MAFHLCLAFVFYCTCNALCNVVFSQQSKEKETCDIKVLKSVANFIAYSLHIYYLLPTTAGLNGFYCLLIKIMHLPTEVV